MIITSHMQKIIQIHPCLLKLSRKHESVMDGRTDSRYYYIPHRYRGGIKTNEPTASNSKSDRPQVNIWDNWKSLKYLNINDSFHLKDLEIYKYKREANAQMPIQFCCLIFVNCG